MKNKLIGILVLVAIISTTSSFAFEIEVEVSSPPPLLVRRELAELWHYIVIAHEMFDVDPYFIAAVMIHESGWGESRIAQDKNNLFGLNAIDASPYDSAFRFRRREDSILFFASMIRENYIDKGRNTIPLIGKRYASDPAWADKVLNTMNNLMR